MVEEVRIRLKMSKLRVVGTRGTGEPQKAEGLQLRWRAGDREI